VIHIVIVESLVEMIRTAVGVVRLFLPDVHSMTVLVPRIAAFH